jgi:hypothetical protein
MAPERDALIVRLPQNEGDDEASWKPVRVPLNNRLVPQVEVVDLQAQRSGVYRYSYKICNLEAAADRIEQVLFPVPLGRETLCMSHSSWPAPCGPRAIMTQNVPKSFPWPSYSSWIRPLEQPAIEPGGCLDGFVIESDFLPGFLQAAFRGLVVHYAPDRMNWPEKVLAQAAELEERDWFEKYFLTLGPAIPPDTQGRARAAALLRGIQELIKYRQLKADSPFILEVTEWVKARSNSDATKGWHLETGPSGIMEKEIEIALQLNFPR